MAESWVGGDIGGLRQMADTLLGAVPNLQTVGKILSSGVDGLVNDAGWQGGAATSFRASWSKDAITGGALAELVRSAGTVLNELATNLAAAENAAHDAADLARGKGVPVGPNGVPGQLVVNNPPSAKEQQAVSDLDSYGVAYNEAMQAAQHARLVAAKQLQQLYADVDPSKPMSAGDKITAADYLRGLWAIDAERNRQAGKAALDELNEAVKDHNKALADLAAEEAKLRTAQQNLPKTFKLNGEWRASVEKVSELETELSGIENSSTTMPYDRQLNFKLADAAESVRGLSALEKLPDFLKEIPVIDVAAAATTGVLEARTDHDEGWSWQHSLLVDGGAALGGLALGVGAVAAAPVEGVVATAALGGAVVVGAGLVVDKAFHEHWSEDIHDHGVVGGVLHGAGHVFTETGKSLKGMGEGVWHGITSIF